MHVNDRFITLFLSIPHFRRLPYRVRPDFISWRFLSALPLDYRRSDHFRSHIIILSKEVYARSEGAWKVRTGNETAYGGVGYVLCKCKIFSYRTFMMGLVADIPISPGGCLIVVAFLWLGWGGYKPSTPWIVPALSGIPLGIASVMIFVSSDRFIVDFSLFMLIFKHYLAILANLLA